jgi:hypothetical protein
MVAVTSTAPAGCLVRLVLIDLRLGNTGQCLTVVLERFLLVTLECTGRFPLLPAFV